jgi:hypothetical protein
VLRIASAAPIISAWVCGNYAHGGIIPAVSPKSFRKGPSRYVLYEINSDYFVAKSTVSSHAQKPDSHLAGISGPTWPGIRTVLSLPDFSGLSMIQIGIVF